MSQFTLSAFLRLPLPFVGLGLLGPASAQTFHEQTKLVASDAARQDEFGLSVSLSGDTVLVGASSNDHSGFGNAGAAYVFVRNGTGWIQQAKLVASDPGSGDEFGIGVSLSGDTAIVGALRDSNGPLGNAGSAYVFVRSGTTWTQQAKLSGSGPFGGTFFGHDVSLSGDTAVIGAPTDGGCCQPGSAYVFVRSGTTWTQQAQLLASDGAWGELFGLSVSVSGDTALVGAMQDSDSGLDAGSAYVFVRNGTTWMEQAKLLASDGAEGDLFGRVALSGETALIGALGADLPGASPEAGAAYVFVRSGTTWTEQAKLVASDAVEHDQLGNSVSLQGDTAILGANIYTSSTPGQGNAGAAYVFTRNGTTWLERDKLSASDATTGDLFGHFRGVALSGDTLVVGAFRDTHCAGEEGSVYVFGPGPGPAPHPNITAIDPQSIPPLIPGTAQTIQLTGTGFDLITELRLDCVPLDPARYTLVGSNLITLDMPQGPVGPRLLSVTDGMYADAIGLHVYSPLPPQPPIYQLGNGDPLNVVDRDDGLSFILSGPVGSVQYVLASPSNLPSINRYASLDIGNNFTQLWVGPRYVIPTAGWLEVTIPASSLVDPGPSGIVFYSQTLGLPQPLRLPFDVSNLQSMQLVP